MKRHIQPGSTHYTTGDDMVNVQTCQTCNYCTNVKGDMTAHRKKYHGKPVPCQRWGNVLYECHGITGVKVSHA